MSNPEKVYQSPALTQGWKNLKDGDFYLFDTVNHYAKKYHLDKKNAPIGWDEEAYTVEEAKECFEDDACTAILGNKKERSWSSSRLTSLASWPKGRDRPGSGGNHMRKTG